MTWDTLHITKDARGVAHVALNLPDKRNALSPRMIDELTRLAAETPSMGLRAMVLSGEGPVFCAGGDLDWMKAQIRADRATRMAEARKLAMMLKALNELPIPLIGRLHGSAFGGGVGLACICDVALAADSTRFGLTETRLGLIPATIGPYVLARIGEGLARRIFMSGRVFDAKEAEKLGLIARALPEAALDQAIEAEITPYLSAAPGAVARAKALTRSLGPRIDEAVIEETIRHLADAWETEELAEGIAAFLEKRPPRWAKPSED